MRSYIECLGAYCYHEMVPMQDGAEICCLIAKPEKEGKFPTVINQSGYHFPTEKYDSDYFSAALLFMSAENLTPYLQNGYAVVIIQSRGTGNSPWPEWMPYEYETRDKLEVNEWIRRQDFYNGELFFVGGSYMGFTSACGLAGDHHDVKAISMAVPVGRRYDCWYHKGFVNVGCMCNWQMVYERPMGQNREAHFMGITFGAAYEPTLNRFNKFPYTSWPLGLYYKPDKYWNDILTHPEDGVWWRKESYGHEIYHALENIDVPLLLGDDFYDIFFDNSYKLWTELPENIREKSAFIANQYGHGGYAGVWPWEGKNTLDQFSARTAEFFNCVRRGEVPTSFQLGAINFTPPADGHKVYVEKGILHNGSTEHTLILNNRTLDTVSHGCSPITYTYNPHDPAEFVGSNITGNSSYYNYGGLGLEKGPNWRQDVLSFVSEPFTESQYIKGAFDADIMVSSNCEDTCFIIRFNVVKNGLCYNMREDITSLSHEFGTYLPGEKVRVHFETSPIVLKLEAGDSLRVDISSSASRMYSVHTNVAGNQYEITEPKIAQNTVYGGESSIHFYTEKDLDKLYAHDL